jgi:2-phosphosulfolactate phosphatase
VAIEDLLGAGAVAASIDSQLAPEAEAAAAVFTAAKGRIEDILVNCPSGQELVARGLEQDVRMAAELGASQSVPRMADGVYQWLT